MHKHAVAEPAFYNKHIKMNMGYPSCLLRRQRRFLSVSAYLVGGIFVEIKSAKESE